jgi:hypothetical protein
MSNCSTTSRWPTTARAMASRSAARAELDRRFAGHASEHLGLFSVIAARAAPMTASRMVHSAAPASSNEMPALQLVSA